MNAQIHEPFDVTPSAGPVYSIPRHSDMSDKIDQLATALAAAQGEITGALKGTANDFFKSKYADLAACWDACREHLSSNGLSVIQTTEPAENGITVVTTLAHKSGQWMRGRLTMTPDKAGPQALGSCITYARRYALAAIVGLAQVDDDAESATFRMPKNVEGKIVKAMDKAISAEDWPGAYEVWSELSEDEKTYMNNSLDRHRKKAWREAITKGGHMASQAANNEPAPEPEGVPL